jgi:hypothetical protein
MQCSSAPVFSSKALIISSTDVPLPVPASQTAGRQAGRQDGLRQAYYASQANAAMMATMFACCNTRGPNARHRRLQQCAYWQVPISDTCETDLPRLTGLQPSCSLPAPASLPPRGPLPGPSRGCSPCFFITTSSLPQSGKHAHVQRAHINTDSRTLARNNRQNRQKQTDNAHPG